MVQRCTNPKRRYYHRYGGRGIVFHPPWADFAVFLADMGTKPVGTSLDRIDNDGSYTPKNCRWATQSEQMLNSSAAIYITIDGITGLLSQWDAELAEGLTRVIVRRRLKRGWSPKEAISTPLKTAKDKRRSYKRNKDHSVK